MKSFVIIAIGVCSSLVMMASRIEAAVKLHYGVPKDVYSSSDDDNGDIDFNNDDNIKPITVMDSVEKEPIVIIRETDREMRWYLLTNQSIKIDLKQYRVPFLIRYDQMIAIGLSVLFASAIVSLLPLLTLLILNQRPISNNITPSEIERLMQCEKELQMAKANLNENKDSGTNTLDSSKQQSNKGNFKFCGNIKQDIGTCEVVPNIQK